MTLFTPHEKTPTFNEVLKDYPEVAEFVAVPPTTKLQHHRAGKLTEKVWAELTANPYADTSMVSVTTQEMPLIELVFEKGVA